MNTKLMRSAALALSLFPLAATPAAQRIESPGPDARAGLHGWLRVPSLIVRARVQDGIASTELEQTIRNEARSDAEAIWILPLPRGATADGFTMTVGGNEMAGEVLDANRARSIYEQIVRQRRDPGLLEYFGDGCLRARIFPIPSLGEVKVKVRWRQVLQESGGMHAWTFPLRALASSGLAAERTSVDLTVASSKPLKNVFSPLPGVDIVRKGDFEARATLEFDQKNPPGRDPSILYSLSEREFGLNLLTWRRAGEPGYYMLMLAPKREWEEPKQTHKFVQFVLDTSGSMQGRKIEQAKEALRFFVKSLAPTDHFNVIPFATDANPFFEAPVAANLGALAAALQKIDRIEARGGTNIEDALLRALAAAPPAASSVPIVVFLTDGEPTVGTTDKDKLLALARDKNGHRMRVFVFGVGNQVNAKLLDQLADDNGGARDYVREDENLEVKTGDLLTKLSHPVLTDVVLKLDGIETSDAFPKRMPDLFKSSQLIAVGRYHGEGHKAIRLRGVLDGVAREFVYEGEFPAQSSTHEFVPMFWAERKVAQILDAIRLTGQNAELMRELQTIAKEYGIVTPFTSHLILEEGMRLGFAPGAGGGAGPGGPSTPGPTAAARDRLTRLGRADAGEEAVAESKALRGSDDFFMGGARREAPKDKASASANVRTVGARAFYLAGATWVDKACPADWEKQAKKVVAFSPEYFALLLAHADLRATLALGASVAFVLDGAVMHIVPAPATDK